MAASEHPARPKPAFVYMVRCTGGQLYTGWTNAPAARLQAHKSGRGARYTRARGAAAFAYVERCADKRADAMKLVRDNLELCGLLDRARVRSDDSLAYLRSGEKFDLIFLDPPYASGLLEQALSDIAGFDICREHGIIMAESPADAVLPALEAPYRLYREYRYGKIKLTVYHRQGSEE